MARSCHDRAKRGPAGTSWRRRAELAERGGAMTGRWVEVDPERLPRWLAGFTERHGPSTVDIDGYAIRLRAADGEVAMCHTPPGTPEPVDLDGFVAAAQQERRLDALVAGGDRRLVDAVLSDARLASLAPLRSARFLDVPDPKLNVLQAAVRGARTVRIRLEQPDP